MAPPITVCRELFAKIEERLKLAEECVPGLRSDIRNICRRIVALENVTPADPTPAVAAQPVAICGEHWQERAETAERECSKLRLRVVNSEGWREHWKDRAEWLWKERVEAGKLLGVDLSRADERLQDAVATLKAAADRLKEIENGTVCVTPAGWSSMPIEEDAKLRSASSASPASRRISSWAWGSW